MSVNRLYRPELSYLRTDIKQDEQDRVSANQETMAIVDIVNLASEHMTDQSIMNGLIGLLNPRLEHRKSYVCTTSESTELVHMASGDTVDTIRYRRILDKLETLAKSKQLTRIFFPLHALESVILRPNEQGNHWLMLSFTVADNTWSLYDSLSPSRATFEQVQENLNRIAKTLTNCNDFPSRKVVRTMKQTNSFDCGIHVMANIIGETFGVPLQPYPISIKELRLRLQAFLVLGVTQNREWRGKQLKKMPPAQSEFIFRILVDALTL